jgi:hypothetical protein
MLDKSSFMPNDGNPNPLEMLYRARWNIPRAAEALGLPPCEESWEKVKEDFRQWAVSHPLLSR